MLSIVLLQTIDRDFCLLLQNMFCLFRVCRTFPSVAQISFYSLFSCFLNKGGIRICSYVMYMFRYVCMNVYICMYV